jgi:sigma-70-like protein/SnoaL-like protein
VGRAPDGTPATAAAIGAGDESAFVALAERYRRQLHVHCYRMVGSLEDAEDLVQESVLRAWRGRTSFEGRSSFRGWLYMQAHEDGDMDSLARLLRDDARVSAAPLPLWFDGRDAFLASARRSAAAGRFRFLATRANGQLAAASYVRESDGSGYRPLAIDVLRIEADRVAEITTFLRPDLFVAFGLPPKL